MQRTSIFNTLPEENSEIPKMFWTTPICQLTYYINKGKKV
jgi:hypothetical protein